MLAAKYVREKRVLDIACGSGYGSNILKTQGKASGVIGVDISAESITYAKSRYKTASVEFLRGNIEEIAFLNDLFDIIISFETIEHVMDCEKALSEIVRALRSGGMLIMSTPNRKLSSPGKSITDPPDNPFHISEYNKKEFISLLSHNLLVKEIYGQRKIHTFFTMPLIIRLMRPLFPSMYGPHGGNSKIYKSSIFFEFRYTIAICQK